MGWQCEAPTFLHFRSSDKFAISHISHMTSPCTSFLPWTRSERKPWSACQRHPSVGTGAQGSWDRAKGQHCCHSAAEEGRQCCMLLSSPQHSIGKGLVGTGEGWDLAAAPNSTTRAEWYILGLTTLGFVFFQVPSSLAITCLRAGSSAWESGSSFWSQCSAMGWSFWLSLPLPATSLQLSSSSAP